MIATMIKEIKRFFRDPGTVFFTIIFPLLLIFVLGSFLENMDNADNAVGEINIHYYSLNVDTQNETAMMMFLESLYKSSGVFYEITEDLEASLEKVDQSKLDGVIAFQEEEITWYTGINDIKNRTMELLLNGFNRTKAIYISVAKQQPELLDEIDQVEENPMSDYTSTKDLGVNRTMIDYYAIAMIVMSLFMSNLIVGANSVREEKQLSTNRQLFISPMSKAYIYIGRVIGNTIPAILQFVVIMVSSVVLFGANYCKDIKGNIMLIAMMLCATIAIISIGMFICLFWKQDPAGILMPIAWGMLFLSGIFSKEIHWEGVSEYMPPNLIKEAAFDLTIFGRYESAWNVIGVSILLVIVFTALGTMVYCRKGGGK